MTAPAKIASSASTNDFKNAGGGAVLTEWIVSEVVVLWPIVTHSPGSGERPLAFPSTCQRRKVRGRECPSAPRLALPPYLSETAPEPGRFTSVAVCPRWPPHHIPPGINEPAGAGSFVGAADQVYRLFLIFAASSVCASANVRTIAAANAANAFGVGAVTEGFAGQTTMTKLGLSSRAGWSSIAEPVAGAGESAAGEHGGG